MTKILLLRVFTVATTLSLIISFGASTALAFSQSEIDAVCKILDCDSDQRDALEALLPKAQSERTCTQFRFSLYRGLNDTATGGEVSRLQEFLEEKGYYSFGSITGYFGPVTEAAVKKWQASEGIVSSGDPFSTGFGRVGPRTRSQLNVRNKCEETTPRTLSVTVSNIQSKSNEPGEVDSGLKASIYGTGLAGPLDIKVGNIEPNYVKTTGKSNTYAEFIVPSYKQTIYTGVVVTNASGATSAFFPIKIFVSDSYTDKSSLRVIYPNGGEGLTQGLSYEIRWTSDNLDDFRIDLDLVDTRGYVIENIVSGIRNDGSYTWILDMNIVPGSYKILVGSSDKGPTAQDYSDDFFIISASANQQESLTIIEPNIGDGEIAGFTRNTYSIIKWSTIGISSSAKVYIDLVGSGVTYRVDEDLLNDGTHSLFINSDVDGTLLPDGAYAMKVCAQTSSEKICDIVGPISISDKG